MGRLREDRSSEGAIVFDCLEVGTGEKVGKKKTEELQGATTLYFWVEMDFRVRLSFFFFCIFLSKLPPLL